MTVHVFVEFFRVSLQCPDTVVDDAAIGLVTDHPVYLPQRQPALRQHFVQAAGQSLHCKAEYGPPVHGDGGRAGTAGPAGLDGLAAPCPQTGGKGESVRNKLEHCCPCPISEQNAGGAVSGVQQAAQSFAADHQGVLAPKGHQQAPGSGGCIHKTGTGCVDIQGGDIFPQAKRRLHPAGHTGGGIRGRKGGADAAADIGRGQAAAFQRLFCSRNGQGGGGLLRGAPVPRPDAGAADDPFVAGIHGAAQIFIGHGTAGQCPAGGDQLQTLHASLVSPI